MSRVKYGLYYTRPRVGVALDSYPWVPRLPPNRGFQVLFIGSTCWLPPWAAPLQVKFQQDYFGASLARRPLPSASGCGAPDAGDQLHVASGARSPPLAAPELLTRLLQKGGEKKKYLFLSGSIQAASPELNPVLLQSVRYQILQKVEHRKKKNKKCVTEMENLHRSGRAGDYFALKLNGVTGGTLRQTRHPCSCLFSRLEVLWVCIARVLPPIWELSGGDCSGLQNALLVLERRTEQMTGSAHPEPPSIVVAKGLRSDSGRFETQACENRVAGWHCECAGGKRVCTQAALAARRRRVPRPFAARRPPGAPLLAHKHGARTCGWQILAGKGLGRAPGPTASRGEHPKGEGGETLSSGCKEKLRSGGKGGKELRQKLCIF